MIPLKENNHFKTTRIKVQVLYSHFNIKLITEINVNRTTAATKNANPTNHFLI